MRYFVLSVFFVALQHFSIGVASDQSQIHRFPGAYLDELEEAPLAKSDDLRFAASRKAASSGLPIRDNANLSDEERKLHSEGGGEVKKDFSALNDACLMIDRVENDGELNSVASGKKLLIDVSPSGFGSYYETAGMSNVSDVTAYNPPVAGVLVKDIVINGRDVPAGSQLYWCRKGGCSAADLVIKRKLVKNTLVNKLFSVHWMRQKGKQAAVACYNLISWACFGVAFGWRRFWSSLGSIFIDIVSSDS